MYASLVQLVTLADVSKMASDLLGFVFESNEDYRLGDGHRLAVVISKHREFFVSPDEW